MAVGLSTGQSIHYNLSASCSDRGISSLLYCICQFKGRKIIIIGKKKKRCWNQRPLGLGLANGLQMSERTLFIRSNDLSNCPIFTAHEKCSLFRISDFLGVGASRLYILITSRMEEIKLKKLLPSQHVLTLIRTQFSNSTPHPP